MLLCCRVDQPTVLYVLVQESYAEWGNERRDVLGVFDTLDVLTTNYKGAQSHWVQRTTRRVMWNPSGTSRLDGWGSSSAESSRVTRGSNAIR